MSSARMGADPETSVTDPDGAVRGTDGLYIADACLLPTSVGVNPMMTIIACSLRVAGGIATRLSGSSRPPRRGAGDTSPRSRR